VTRVASRPDTSRNSGGAVLTAIGTPYDLMVIGRFIFGVSEGAIFIALVAGLAQWFSRSGIALATALYLSLARVGSYAVDTSLSIGRPDCPQGRFSNKPTAPVGWRCTA
jgi:hypothetical protein